MPTRICMTSMRLERPTQSGKICSKRRSRAQSGSKILRSYMVNGIHQPGDHQMDNDQAWQETKWKSADIIQKDLRIRGRRDMSPIDE